MHYVSWLAVVIPNNTKLMKNIATKRRIIIGKARQGKNEDNRLQEWKY